jgi:coenzyme F420-reducing hydrogenase beta subunit
MLHDFLERNIPVICLVENNNGYRPEILRSAESIGRVPGSIYHSVSFTGTIGLLREVEAPCLLVTLPCQLEGLRNFIRHVEPALREKLALTVGLVCGWSFSEHAPKAFIHYKGLKGEVRDFRYRGGDKVGRLKFIPKGGVSRSYPRREFRSFKEKLDYKACFTRFLHRIRCRLCRDHTNILADVVVGDAWLERYREEKVSLTVSRTAQGQKALEEAASRGHILLQEGRREDIAESQSEDLLLGISAEFMGRYRRSRGFPSPEFTFSPYRAEWPSFSLKTRIIWEREHRLRRVVRSGRYRTYRLLFALLEAGMLPAEIRRWLGRLRGRA